MNLTSRVALQITSFKATSTSASSVTTTTSASSVTQQQHPLQFRFRFKKGSEIEETEKKFRFLNEDNERVCIKNEFPEIFRLFSGSYHIPLTPITTILQIILNFHETK